MSIYTAQPIPTDGLQWAEKFYRVKAGTAETGAALQAARTRANALMRVDSDSGSVCWNPGNGSSMPTI